MDMKLRTYMKKRGVTGRAMAIKLDVTEGSIWNLLSMKHTPSLQLAFKIEDLTKGRVKARDFYEEHEAKKLSEEGDKSGPPKVSKGNKKSAVLVEHRGRKDNNIHKPNKRPLRSRAASGNRSKKKKLS